MNKTQFLGLLRQITAELEPLTRSSRVRGGDPTALVWFGTLTAIEALISGQDTPLTVKQRAYLQTLLFGGMGSLQDVFFDPKPLGEAAVIMNKRLKEQVSELFQSFQE